ncbi:cysteine desulfurase-like protein [Geodermatophilus sabuli]|uniref:Cysteine desulfurase family protein, VC1184 subfamily n=1 Tax=Geodermatophilus sabuli TaxID=1564158 RepID=A0A285EJF4_9ACTN|nr:cysteine desulfurase-like protein [Geodermatophilus sabuli]MBB3086972.1 cysteine desulfurase family protein (TIGR01976 family) [Geodermatophilus sabuli]SNX99248.1 cysteine desulfurase family protein, VC1184 subfamily [Geodermatophilus sabuli]
MSYDVEAVRACFPALRAGAAHFDGPGGSQVPESVAAAVAATLTAPIANRGRVTQAERNADDVVLAARRAVADLVAGDPGGVVFGRSATQLTYDLSRVLSAGWGPGDEVVVTRLDHDANVRPWVQAAAARGATVRWAGFDPATGELAPEAVAAVLSERTRLVAVTGASNLIGTRPDLATITAQAHDAGALTYVDGVHLTAHAAVDVAALGADLYACSPYKFLGPHCGCVVAAPALLETLRPDKLLPSTDAVPERFELGTLPYELLAGTTAAVDFLAGLGGPEGDRRARLEVGMAAVEEHEDRLRERIEDGVRALPGVTVWSRARRRTPTLLMTFEGRDAADGYRFLAERGVNAPAGSFYAIEASRWLGLGDAGGLRVGLAPYNDDADVDRLLAGLGEWLAA